MGKVNVVKGVREGPALNTWYWMMHTEYVRDMLAMEDTGHTIRSAWSARFYL